MNRILITQRPRMTKGEVSLSLIQTQLVPALAPDLLQRRFNAHPGRVSPQTLLWS